MEGGMNAMMGNNMGGMGEIPSAAFSNQPINIK